MALPSGSIAAAASLLALGVHAITALVLLTLDATNRAVRWYVAFLALMTGWLAGEAAQALWGVAPRATLGVLSHLLPLSFLAFALVVTRDVPTHRLAVPGAVGLVLLPLTLAASPWYTPAVDAIYQGVAWTAATLALAFRPARAGVSEPPARRRVRTAIVVVAFAILGLIHGPREVAVVVPVLSSFAQGLVLFGAIRLQLYGLAERAARTGALARDTAELERLALLGELGATVAHEVRNPLTGIRSVAQRLADGEEVSPERRARFARLIVDEVDRLERFVSGLLAAARRGPGAIAVVGEATGTRADPATAVPALLDDLETLVAAHARASGVRLAFTADVPTIPAPRGPVAQLLLNLMLNAVTHSPAGGTVRVHVSRDAEGTHAVVRDEGPGLPPDAADTLFTPFAPGARGTGLGLAIVRRVADARGWRVRGENGSAGGARFTLTVPAAVPTAVRWPERETA